MWHFVSANFVVTHSPKHHPAFAVDSEMEIVDAADIPIMDDASELVDKPSAKRLFCGNCFSDCEAATSRWQKVTCSSSDVATVKRLRLRRACDNALWRVFNGLEERHDKEETHDAYHVFLEHELGCK